MAVVGDMFGSAVKILFSDVTVFQTSESIAVNILKFEQGDFTVE